MASSVFYKFKSRKDESRVTFDGTGISVFDLKKEIIIAHNLGKANDFDLYIYDRSTEKEYKDDSEVIPRSSSVIVKRMPAAKPGKGKAAMYLAAAGAPNGAETLGTGTGANTWNRSAMSKRFDSVKEETTGTQGSTPAPVSSSLTQDDEAAAMAAMFKAQTANWEETQEKMSQATYIPFSGTRGGRPPNATQRPFQQQHRPSDRPLPSSYVCYRCGQKGHWIQDCPTNNDRDFDNRPRIKRTTGIPRSFLKAVENPTDAQGVMVTPEGGFVVAQPDVASWQRHLNRQTKVLTESDVRERPPIDPTLACPIDGKLFRDAVRTPCCAQAFCEECVQTHLLERDFTCPGCGKRIPSLDKLEKDADTRRKVKEYIEKTIEDGKNQGEEGGKSEVDVTNSGPTATNSDGAVPTNDPSSAVDQAQQQTDEGTTNMAQVIADSVPQLQAQVQQLALMLNNPSLPPAVRQQTERQHGLLQLQLGHAQTIALALAAQSGNVGADVHAFQQAGGMLGMPGPQGGPMGMNMGMGMSGGMGMGMGMPGAQGGFANTTWGAQFANQSGQVQDSAYQRLPVNNRRRNLKRDRPSDFVDLAGSEGDAKQARYYEGSM